MINTNIKYNLGNYYKIRNIVRSYNIPFQLTETKFIQRVRYKSTYNDYMYFFITIHFETEEDEVTFILKLSNEDRKNIILPAQEGIVLYEENNE